MPVRGSEGLLAGVVACSSGERCCSDWGSPGLRFSQTLECHPGRGALGARARFCCGWGDCCSVDQCISARGSLF
jgi:hypothetical protein